MTVTATDAESQRRFDEYIGVLAAAMGHADRLAPLHHYCTGLFLLGQRKSVEPMAAITAPGRLKAQHNSLLHFVGNSPWDDADILAAVRSHFLPSLQNQSPYLVWPVDDTGIVKKGRHSVGVARQYCGQVGKQENCQVAVSLTIADDFGSLPIAYQLYLPESWAGDVERRKKAQVPDDIEFLSKPQIALSQIEDAVRSGVPRGPVLADAAYGNEHGFRARITELGLQYCVGIQSTTTVWPPGMGPLPPLPRQRMGRPPTRVRRAPDHKPVSVKELAQSLPPSQYRTIIWREGTRAAMRSRFVAVRVRAAHRDDTRAAPHAEEWLLIEWPPDEPAPTKYWLSTLPKRTTLKELVNVAKLRWRIERDCDELKDEFGLDHYEGRKWRGFHHHATLCIAVYAFLMREHFFPPRRKLTPSRSSRRLPYPSASNREALPLRPERHQPMSIATMKARLAAALAESLQRCPFRRRSRVRPARR